MYPRNAVLMQSASLLETRVKFAAAQIENLFQQSHEAVQQYASRLHAQFL
jgi:hypothetical protein